MAFGGVFLSSEIKETKKKNLYFHLIEPKDFGRLAIYKNKKKNRITKMNNSQNVELD